MLKECHAVDNGDNDDNSENDENDENVSLCCVVFGMGLALKWSQDRAAKLEPSSSQTSGHR